MWQWRSDHNYLEKEQNLSSIVICYNVLHCSQKAAQALVLECYVHKLITWLTTTGVPPLVHAP
jgi:hypothetical protein